MGEAKLVRALNEDLAAEWGTVIRYTYQAGKCSGPVGEHLRAFFGKETREELGHAAFLTDVIVDLGGEPGVVPESFDKPTGLREMLELDLRLELAAAERYLQHAQLAAELNEVELQVKLEAMAADEAGHARELRRLLRGL